MSLWNTNRKSYLVSRAQPLRSPCSTITRIRVLFRLRLQLSLGLADVFVVRWRQGRVELTEEASIPLGENVLQLSDIQHSATYTCVAQSELGIVQADAEVTVTGLFINAI